jgi:uncharacterized iron-regulated membrane protein
VITIVLYMMNTLRGYMMNKKAQTELGIGVMITIIGLLLLVGSIFAYAGFKPWFAQQTGKAELAQAEQNRQILITQAEAENTAATSQAQAKIKIAQAEAQAEIERAKGAAEANKILGESLKDNEDYLHYLYITGVMSHSSSQVIYIPTEASLPILEAGQR